MQGMTCDDLAVEPRSEADQYAERPSDRAAVARDREGRLVGGLSGLLSRRPELRGVHAPADWFDDAIRWGA